MWDFEWAEQVPLAFFEARPLLILDLIHLFVVT